MESIFDIDIMRSEAQKTFGTMLLNVASKYPLKPLDDFEEYGGVQRQWSSECARHFYPEVRNSNRDIDVWVELASCPSVKVCELGRYDPDYWRTRAIVRAAGSIERQLDVLINQTLSIFGTQHLVALDVKPLEIFIEVNNPMRQGVIFILNTRVLAGIPLKSFLSDYMLRWKN